MYWTHHKTGKHYVIQGFGMQEETLTPSVLYQQVEDPSALVVVEVGPVWVRPCSEFFDGRFKQEIPIHECEKVHQI